MHRFRMLFVCLLSLTLTISPCLAEDRLEEINRKSAGTLPSESEHLLIWKVLFYIPNRILDLADVFRVDVGIGTAAGLVVRATQQGQCGARTAAPFDLRLGYFGREVPFLIEREYELGCGSKFKQSRNRKVTPYEIGIGADLVLGAYAGISVDEIVDFFSGIIFIDLKNDDI